MANGDSAIQLAILNIESDYWSSARIIKIDSGTNVELKQGNPRKFLEQADSLDRFEGVTSTGVKIDGVILSVDARQQKVTIEWAGAEVAKK